jgi:hypothetical protein
MNEPQPAARRTNNFREPVQLLKRWLVAIMLHLDGQRPDLLHLANHCFCGHHFSFPNRFQLLRKVVRVHRLALILMGRLL